MPLWLELVDTADLKPAAFGRGGSSPSSGTTYTKFSEFILKG